MNRRTFVVFTLVAGFGFAQVAGTNGQSKAITPDLAALADSNSLKLVNRTVTRLVDGSRTGVRVSAGPGEGIAYLPGIEFVSGETEFDVRGKDVAQPSVARRRSTE